MIKQFKFKGDESKFFFISDLHYGHSPNWEIPLCKRRGYNTVEQMNSAIIENWNKVCDNTSQVFNLGDFVFQDPTGEKFIELHNKLNFQILFCLEGNHLSGHKQVYINELKKQFPNAYTDKLNFCVYPLEFKLNDNKKIIFMPEYMEVIINKTVLCLCHYPLYVHNYQKDKSISLVGHSHSSCSLTNKDTGRGMRLDCGFESFQRPISLTEVKEWLKNRDLDQVDHHQ